MLDFISIQVVIPNFFYVAAHTWGVEVLSLSLVPLALSLIVLFFSCIQLVHAVFVEEKHRLLVLALVVTLVGLVTAALVRLFVVGTETVSSFYTPSFVLGAAGLLCAWVLLFVLYRPVSFTILLYLGMGAVFGLAGYGSLWMGVEESHLSDAFFVIGESLIFIAVGFIGIFVEHLPPMLRPITS